MQYEVLNLLKYQQITSGTSECVQPSPDSLIMYFNGISFELIFSTLNPIIIRAQFQQILKINGIEISAHVQKLE